MATFHVGLYMSVHRTLCSTSPGKHCLLPENALIGPIPLAAEARGLKAAPTQSLGKYTRVLFPVSP